MYKRKHLIFLFQEMYRYKRYSVLLPPLACILQVSQSLLFILLPKVVLDAVSGSQDFEVLAGRTAAIGLGLTAATLLNLIFHNELDKCSQTFLFRRLTAMWQRKTLRLDYNVLVGHRAAVPDGSSANGSSVGGSLVGGSSANGSSVNGSSAESRNGKVLMEKARQAISSPNRGIVELLGREAAVLEAGIGLAVYCILVGRLHPLILVILGLFFLIELASGIRTENKKQNYKEQKTKADRRINYIAYGTRGMQEAKDIRIFSMEAMLKRIAREVIRDKDGVETEIQRQQFRHTLVSALMILVRDSAAYLFLIHRYRTSEMSVGDFSLYFAAITGIGMWMSRLSEAISGFGRVCHYIQDFCEFLALPEETGEKMSPMAAEKQRRQAAAACGREAVHETGIKIDGPISFELKNISFSYRKTPETEECQKREESGACKIPVIQNLSLHVGAGEKIAIVGTNGTGKSTLIKLLCGMLTPDQGEILVNGINMRDFRKEEYYKLFSAVFQKSRILPVSIADNIMLNVRETQDKEAMWECLRKAGLEEKVRSLPKQEETCLQKEISEDGTQLSGGQEQRLLLARALYKDAPVLILDEPTAALDPIAESEIYRQYGELTKGKTSFFISHRLASTRFCDVILFMENGRIAECGTHDELLKKNGRYAEMFRVQSKYYQDGGI